MPNQFKIADMANVGVFQPSTVLSSPAETESTTDTPSTALPTTTDLDITITDLDSSHDIGDLNDETTTNDPGATIGTDSVKGNSTTIVGSSLGGVAAILLLVLVGVVLGWVWTCRRSKTKSSR